MVHAVTHRPRGLAVILGAEPGWAGRAAPDEPLAPSASRAQPPGCATPNALRSFSKWSFAAWAAATPPTESSLGAGCPMSSSRSAITRRLLLSSSRTRSVRRTWLGDRAKSFCSRINSVSMHSVLLAAADAGRQPQLGRHQQRTEHHYEGADHAVIDLVIHGDPRAHPGSRRCAVM